MASSYEGSHDARQQKQHPSSPEERGGAAGRRRLALARSQAGRKRSWPRTMAPWLASSAWFAGCLAVAGRWLAPAALAVSRGRVLQSAEDVNPTIDETDSTIFSRPPYSQLETNTIVFYVVAGAYLLCAILVLVAVNLDQAEQRRRRQRAIVPEESVPCAVAEQHFLDEYFVGQGMQSIAQRKKKMSFWGYLGQNFGAFGEKISRYHLCLSFFIRAMPTFTRLKRALAVIVHLHLCMLAAAMSYNVVEHDKPQGRYELLSCDGGRIVDAACTATLPLSLIAAVATYPLFRFCVYRQLRLTCFMSQGHPSNSTFPLNVQKFARIPPKTAMESFLCMRNSHEREMAGVIKSRRFIHRFVHMLWMSTKPSSADARFYSVFASYCILFLQLAFIAFTLVYVLLFTAYFRSEVVYHWFSWMLIMFFTTTLVVEPLSILFVEVIYSSVVASCAQGWGFGSHALSATTIYNDVVRQVDMLFLWNLKSVGSLRIQRWWRAVLDMYRALNEQTAAAVKIQSIRKKMVHQKKYVSERKWCMKVEVLTVQELYDATKGSLMCPFLRLQMDVGNPSLMQTKVLWEAGTDAAFNENFLFDIKESKALYVSAWSQELNNEEFVGRGYFDCREVRQKAQGKAAETVMRLPLYAIQHGEKRKEGLAPRGYVNIRASFLDPLKDVCDVDGGWMLPKHRMQFALSKMGGRPKVGKLLGSNPRQMDQGPLPAPEGGGSNIDTALDGAAEPGIFATEPPSPEARPEAGGRPDLLPPGRLPPGGTPPVDDQLGGGAPTGAPPERQDAPTTASVAGPAAAGPPTAPPPGPPQAEPLPTPSLNSTVEGPEKWVASVPGAVQSDDDDGV